MCGKCVEFQPCVPCLAWQRNYHLVHGMAYRYFLMHSIKTYNNHIVKAHELCQIITLYYIFLQNSLFSYCMFCIEGRLLHTKLQLQIKVRFPPLEVIRICGKIINMPQLKLVMNYMLDDRALTCQSSYPV